MKHLTKKPPQKGSFSTSVYKSNKARGTLPPGCPRPAGIAFDFARRRKNKVRPRSSRAWASLQARASAGRRLPPFCRRAKCQPIPQATVLSGRCGPPGRAGPALARRPPPRPRRGGGPGPGEKQPLSAPLSPGARAGREIERRRPPARVPRRFAFAILLSNRPGSA